jgi:pyrroloquinoline quinone (PQQ) biosynthesis protein C
MTNELQKLKSDIEPNRKDLLAHPLYSKLHSLEAIQIFMQQHVFAVWDFMSLLKSLQINLTSIELPWKPVGKASTRRLINEIVWGEESDVDQYGNPASHFELYLRSMEQIGASTSEVLSFVKSSTLDTISIELDKLTLSKNTKDFVNFTFEKIKENKAHELAALFTFGREDLIPDMFVEIVKTVEKQTGNSMSELIYYLERHIEVDGGEHGPMSLEMIQDLCGNDEQKWQEATHVSKEALKMRMHLWDGVLQEIESVQVLN